MLISEEMRNETFLITGGTGTLGSAITRKLAKLGVHKVIVFSRNERAQVLMRRELEGFVNGGAIRYVLGDITNRDQLWRSMGEVDNVIHCAALKHVDMCEYNPDPTVDINVLGSKNLKDVALDRGVKRLLSISTDKAVNPTTLYGAAKLCSDKLMIAGNVYSKLGVPKISVIRFGNFWDSSGSVVEYFKSLKFAGIKDFPITDKRMSRFFIPITGAVYFTLDRLGDMEGGEIFSPKMVTKTIVKVAYEIDSSAKLIEIGARPGEKLHEDLILSSDAHNTYDCGNHFTTYPPGWSHVQGEKVKEGFYYNSRANRAWGGVC